MLVFMMCVFFFFKQKTAYEMRISDWSSDVCSSDLTAVVKSKMVTVDLEHLSVETVDPKPTKAGLLLSPTGNHGVKRDGDNLVLVDIARGREQRLTDDGERSEEHTSELQSLMRISYAVFCLKKKNMTIHMTRSRHL